MHKKHCMPENVGSDSDGDDSEVFWLFAKVSFPRLEDVFWF